MSDEAVKKQAVPHGKGVDITTLVKGEILEKDFLIPDHGYETVALWLRSAALFIKGRIQAKQGLIEFGKPRYDIRLAHEMIRDLEARSLMGEKKYGERLKSFNGRDADIDLLQELYDGMVYNAQKIDELQQSKCVVPGCDANHTLHEYK